MTKEQVKYYDALFPGFREKFNNFLREKLVDVYENIIYVKAEYDEKDHISYFFFVGDLKSVRHYILVIMNTIEEFLIIAKPEKIDDI